MDGKDSDICLESAQQQSHTDKAFDHLHRANNSPKTHRNFNIGALQKTIQAILLLLPERTRPEGKENEEFNVRGTQIIA